MRKRNLKSHQRNSNETREASLDLEQWQIEHIKASIRQADAGRLIEHEDVKKMVRRWQKERDTGA